MERASRRVSWRPGTEREGGRGRSRGRERMPPRRIEATTPSGRDAAAREFERRTLRFNDTRPVDVGRLHQGRLRGGEVVSWWTRDGGAERPTKRWTAGFGSDPLGYVPYDKRLYDELMRSVPSGETDRRRGTDGWPGVECGGPTSGRGACAARVVDRCSNDAVAEIAGVGPVPVEVVRRLACDANVDLAVEDPEGSILNQGRARRDPTPVQRVEIDRRDKGCRFPGCNYTEFTNVHHIQHWADGGLTNLDNLVTLCGRHHRAVHELGWSVSGDADGVLTFTARTGGRCNRRPRRHGGRRRWSDRRSRRDRRGSATQPDASDPIERSRGDRIGTGRCVAEGRAGAPWSTIRWSGAPGGRSRGSAPSSRWG